MGLEPGQPSVPEDVAATFCATLVDEWVRAGVTDAVVCPGSRSTPMALALHADGRLRVHVRHDERTGGFTALGLGLSTGRPAVVLTTSGTAAVHLHAAVVEAHHAHVPLIAVTADRPPELQGVGAPQTIDQARLYGTAVRSFHAPGVPDDAARATWRATASRVVADALGAAGPGPGPVHVNLAFREPLVGRADPLPERDGTSLGGADRDGAAWSTMTPMPAAADVGTLTDLVRGARRGMIVAGFEPGWTDPAVDVDDAVRHHARALVTTAATLGWPLLVDARLRGVVCEVAPDGAVVVAAADAIVRDPVPAAGLRPDLVIHAGDRPASRVLDEWIASTGATEVRVAPHGALDPTGRAVLRVDAPSIAALGSAVAPRGPARTSDPDPAASVDPAWAGAWRDAEAAAQAAIDATLDPTGPPTEPGTAREVLAALAAGEGLVVSSSMPIRDLEWYGRPRGGVRVVANRGANGIDGVVATAWGVALGTGTPVAVLIGDVALLHDSSSLTGLAASGVDLALVVVDNDGGGIFSFLPQATDPGGAAFEALFGTPHGVDLPALAGAHGIRVVQPATAADVGPAVRGVLDAGGVGMVHVRTDRSANVEVHRRIHDAVAAVLRD
ncbi:MAG: 2-succinyl-5-enolpyruvyl-6-hydroxy-3-cyclohexene-1-carboxylic-acid synthase [Acidimicrobiales bacterium]|nr:2-succinyl-5-enolpyruvyl-6-hydroxy-3-cyclohexene-1-carboxylic-acid synthase [Acidimicrobiales bacterium]